MHVPSQVPENVKPLDFITRGILVFSFVSQIVFLPFLFPIALSLAFCITNFVYTRAPLAFLHTPLPQYIYRFDLPFLPCPYRVKLFNVPQRLAL